jgi:two-component sensor histidine kinase
MARERDELLEQQRALAEFGSFALRSNNLDDILNEGCKLVGGALKTELSKVLELLPDGTAMLVRAGQGWKPGIVGEKRLSLENSPEGLTLREGAVISPSIHREKRFHYHDFMKEHGVQAFVNVLVPLADKRAPFGVLEVDSRAPRDFQQTDIEFLRTYANLLGAAIERLRAVDELRAALKDTELLIHELNHRVKNTLATVQSIAAQTLRNASTPEEAREALESRLMALARAHDVLTRESWEGAELHHILAQALEPYSNRAEDRLHLNGPHVRLPPRTALALAMSLQELATNAVKYGALSNHSGQIHITWRIDEADTSPRLHLRWEEAGGPPVQPPTRRGFGTRLIERSLSHDLNGDAKADFARTGVVWTVDAPITSPRARLP